MSVKAWGVLVLSLLWLAAIPWLGQGDADLFVVEQLRLPRLLMGVMAGVILGLSGAVFQTLFNNPLATPATTGTTAAATLGALVAIVILPTYGALVMPVTILVSFTFAVCASLLVAKIASSGRVGMHQILLAGIAISLAAGALASGVQFTADQASTFQAVRWALGNLGQVGYQRVLYLLPICVLCCVLMLRPIRALQAYLLGESRAFTQGVNVVRVRTTLLIAGSIGVGATVALCGPIAFVGLIIPHMIRLTAGVERAVFIPLSAWYGGVFLATCDLICRSIIPGRELPVGVMTASIGAPVLVWLIMRHQQD